MKTAPPAPPDIASAPAGSGTPSGIAVVHDWLDTWRGGEAVLAEVLAMLPGADLYALVDFLPEDRRHLLGGRRATTSFLQRFPGARRHFRSLLPLFPRAIRSLDLSRYATIVSISHAVAKDVRVRPGQRHYCYCLTPMRYAWDLRDAYFPRGSARALARPLADPLLDRLRAFDRAGSAGVTGFAAISHFVAGRIARHYGRESIVVYPPVDTGFFTPAEGPVARARYLTASHWVPYKRLDAIVGAFAALPHAVLDVAGAGPELARVRERATPNVRFMGAVARDDLREAMRAARAFLFAAEEDFGIVPLEAQACGTPVLAYARGGTAETIVGEGADRSGLWFAEQTPTAIAAAVRDFESLGRPIDAGACRRNALRFDSSRFREGFRAFVGAGSAAAA